MILITIQINDNNNNLVTLTSRKYWAYNQVKILDLCELKLCTITIVVTGNGKWNTTIQLKIPVCKTKSAKLNFIKYFANMLWLCKYKV